MGLNYAIGSYRFFDNYRELLPLNIRIMLSKESEYIGNSKARNQDKGFIEYYVEDSVMSEKDIVKIARRLELKLVKKEIAKLSKKCYNLKKSIKGKKEPVTTEGLLNSIDF